MKPIFDAWCCQIDITNYCHLACLYCSRYNRHLRKDQRQHMNLEAIEKALDSLKSWNRMIGIIGGEPVLHPEFVEICKLIQRKFHRTQMGLWTSGGKVYNDNFKLIQDTFGFIAYNEHNEHQQNTCKHQPLTLAIDEVVKNESIMEKLIDECWVQLTWCPTVNQHGAYFCEIAAAQDLLLNNGINAWEVTEGWWNKTPNQFTDQRNKLCHNCGMAIPIERELIKNKTEKFSPKLLTVFRENNLNKVDDSFVDVYDHILSREEIIENIKTWFPGNYRGDITEDEKCNEGKGFIGELK